MAYFNINSKVSFQFGTPYHPYLSQTYFSSFTTKYKFFPPVLPSVVSGSGSDCIPEAVSMFLRARRLLVGTDYGSLLGWKVSYHFKQIIFCMCQPQAGHEIEWPVTPPPPSPHQ